MRISVLIFLRGLVTNDLDQTLAIITITTWNMIQMYTCIHTAMSIIIYILTYINKQGFIIVQWAKREIGKRDDGRVKKAETPPPIVISHKLHCSLSTPSALRCHPFGPPLPVPPFHISFIHSTSTTLACLCQVGHLSSDWYNYLSLSCTLF